MSGILGVVHICTDECVPDAVWIIMLLAATAVAYIAGGYVGKNWG